MKTILAVLIAVLSIGAGAQTTNFITRTNSNGTKMTIPVTTTRLWRTILQEETAQLSLWDLGLTNYNGFIVGTNNITNTFGIFDVRSTTTDLKIGKVTNSMGLVTAFITNNSVATVTAVNTNVAVTSTTNSDGGVAVSIAGLPSTATTAATLDGYDMTADHTTSNTNFYWLDFGRTNTTGEKLIYATLAANNNVSLIGVTNCQKWGLLSVNVIASGADRLIMVPTNWPHFNTNGWTLFGSLYRLTLSNGNELRLTLHSNSSLSTLWATFGQ